jgi:NhaP-type Na+/H+ or K+/H+ antiporter
MILVLVLYAILLYLYIHTFYYLKKAEHTGCFTPKVNLKYMQFFQLLEIVALTLTIVFFPYFLKMKAKNKKNMSILEPLLITLVVLGINMYMAYNVYHFYFELKQCFELKQQWNKWWLYWEGIASAVASVRGILSLSVITLLLLKLK